MSDLNSNFTRNSINGDPSVIDVISGEDFTEDESSVSVFNLYPVLLL